MMEITNENYKSFCNDYSWEDVDIQAITWEGEEVPFESAKSVFLEVKKKHVPKAMEVVSALKDSGVIISRENARKLSKRIEEDGDLFSAQSFVQNFPLVGCADMATTGTQFTTDLLKEMFRTSPRFRGREPQILPQMSAVCDRFGVDPELVFEKFNIQNYRQLSALGLPKTDVIILGTLLSPAEISAVKVNFEIASMVSYFLEEGRSRGRVKNSYENAAHFVASHASSDANTLRRIEENPDKYTIDGKTSIDAIEAQTSSNIEAEKEIEKIEKAYKKSGFKFKNCVCNLKNTKAEDGSYVAYILDGQDKRQVMLGYDTFCCQHLGDAGESSMMHGLINEKAGFFVIENKNSGKIVAQAESWETEDGSTLVFDNIEFANDADIDNYKDVLGKWVLESSYKNIIMGCGYNTFASCDFETAGAITPPVTAYELYVMSYEEDAYAGEKGDQYVNIPSEEEAQRMLDNGEITYFDYVYCDSERESMYLKKDDKVADYFGIPADIQAQAARRHAFETPKIKAASAFVRKYADIFKELKTNDNRIPLTEKERD